MALKVGSEVVVYLVRDPCRCSILLPRYSAIPIADVRWWVCVLDSWKL